MSKPNVRSQCFFKAFVRKTLFVDILVKRENKKLSSETDLTT